MRLENEHCCMQQADGLCAIHAARGYDAKPPICRDFPFKLIQTPAGPFVGLSFACTAVLGNTGPPILSHPAVQDGGQISEASRRGVADPLLLTEDLPLDWVQYERSKEDLAAMLDPALGPISQRLVMQSIYLRLLAKFLREARGQAGDLAGGPEANRAPLKIFHQRMRPDGGELFVMARRISERRRSSPLLRRTVLGFALSLRAVDRQNLGLLRTIATVARNYTLSAAGRGAVELPAAGAVPYRRLRTVGFDPARPEHDELLTRYFRHRLFRKDLAVAETIQAAHSMLLMHWGLIHWHSVGLAVAGGSPQIDLEHLAEAIRIIEKNYAFHSSFDVIFRRHTLLRGLLDRLMMNPLYAASMGWGE